MMIKKILAAAVCTLLAAGTLYTVYAAENEPADGTSDEKAGSVKVEAVTEEPNDGNTPSGTDTNGRRTTAPVYPDEGQGDTAQPQMPSRDMRDNRWNGEAPVPPEGAFPDGAFPEGGPNFERPQNGMGGKGGNMGGFGNMMPQDMSEQSSAQSANTHETAASPKMGIKEFVVEYATPLSSLILLAAAFVFVILYKRKQF